MQSWWFFFWENMKYTCMWCHSSTLKCSRFTETEMLFWWQRSGSTLAQVMACCLTAPSHYLNQCWLIISKVQWHSSEGSFTRDTSAIHHWNYLKYEVPKMSFKFPRGQWVKAQNLPVHILHTLYGEAMCESAYCNSLRPRQMAAIFQTTFSNAFCWMKMC